MNPAQTLELFEYIAEKVNLLHKCNYNIDTVSLYIDSDNAVAMNLELISRNKDEFETYVLKNSGDYHFSGDFVELVEDCLIVERALNKLDSLELEKIKSILWF